MAVDAALMNSKQKIRNCNHFDRDDIRNTMWRLDPDLAGETLIIHEVPHVTNEYLVTVRHTERQPGRADHQSKRPKPASAVFSYTLGSSSSWQPVCQ